MRLGGNEEDKMKRISPVLFLTLASAMVTNGQTSFAQSQSRDVAPGPIAELLPKSDTPAAGGFDLLGNEPSPNRLPTRNSQSQVLETNALPPADSPGDSIIEPPAGNSPSLFDTPAQPRSCLLYTSPSPRDRG